MRAAGVNRQLCLIPRRDPTRIHEQGIVQQRVFAKDGTSNTFSRRDAQARGPESDGVCATQPLEILLGVTLHSPPAKYASA